MTVPPHPPPGRLFGVGVGPGDPELLTVKARRVIGEVEVIAYPRARKGPGVARTVAAPYLRPDHIDVAMTFPVTTEQTGHPGGYEAALHEFYDSAAEELAEHLDAGRSVAVLCEGDPFFYGSYMYLHDRLAPRYETEVIPGVTSFSAAAAAAGSPLVRRDDVLTIIPGTLGPEAVADRLRATDAAVVMKLGRSFAGVRAAAETAGVADRAIYVERASAPAQRMAALRDVDGTVPYMSLVLVPSLHAQSATGRDSDPGRGEVAVVGLGPAGREWLTPEAQAVLAEAEEIVGYDTYLARVPVRADQRRHGSDNRQELDRARHALELATGGKRVALVSSGDPGIFAMAAALLEVLDGVDNSGVNVRIVPGLSAMQAAAARVGAPLGHDFCVVSLSDQLKPWEMIARRIEAAASADLVLVVYNPASRTRRENLERARTLLLDHRRGETPTIVARDVGGPEERVVVDTLAGFDAADVDMRTLLIIGSSTTRVIEGNGTPRVYTPRRYPA